ncbi:MAG: enoyl-CoA hydratase [Gordonia sp. (in: high G+C Gram-positive bacteria)]|nr:MAG: enoyl-CoA hydratase [Gordonia sp. (in: high G+C Gram-positive bacteria)]
MTTTAPQSTSTTSAAGAGGRVVLIQAEHYWILTISRPEAHNSMTETMYAEFSTAITVVAQSQSARALVIRGDGGQAFASGTDIAHMQTLTALGAGVRYERQVTAMIRQIEDLSIPTMAVIEGHCYGAGLLIAAACDIRIATPGSRFGVPIAKTLGNCLSEESLSLLTSRLGTSRVLDMLLRARTFDTLEMQSTGFIGDVIDPNSLDERVADITKGLTTSAPLTVWATKELLRRQRQHEHRIDDADVIERVYRSDDFADGATAFLARRRAKWSGQ